MGEETAERGLACGKFDIVEEISSLRGPSTTWGTILSAQASRAGIGNSLPQLRSPFCPLVPLSRAFRPYMVLFHPGDLVEAFLKRGAYTVSALRSSS